MKLTTDFIAKSFHRFNKEYFEGSLKTPKFEVMHAKTILGQYCPAENKIRISDFYQRSEKDYQGCIIHEMIHQYIRQNHIKDTNRHHGKVFYSIAARINAKGDWGISRCNSTDGLLPTNDKGEVYHMAMFKSVYGKYFLMKMNEKHIRDFEYRFSCHPDYYVDWFMFDSTDNAYLNFSKCRTNCRGRFITKEEFNGLKNEYGLSVRRVS